MKIDWTKPLRTQNGEAVVVVCSVLSNGRVDVCLKNKEGSLSIRSYNPDGLFVKMADVAQYGYHLVVNTERRWRWLATRRGMQEDVFITKSFYKDQAQALEKAFSDHLILLVKCEELFEDTPIS